MTQPQTNPMPEGHQGTENRRRHGRVETESVMSNLGAVKDLSAGGMRVSCRRPARVGECLPITLKSGTTIITLRGRIAWVARTNILSHQMGVEFLDLNDDLTRSIAQLAISNRVSQTMM